jgi:GNAT superfamily N-acetyltransferase
VRTADEADFPAILNVAAQTRWDKTAYLQRQLVLGNIYVAEQDSDLLGFIVWNREFFSLAFIWLVIVSDRYRRRGIASRLFSFVEEQCKGSRLYSSTNKSDAVMQRFFENRGYRWAGEVDVDPGDPEVFYLIHL